MKFDRETLLKPSGQLALVGAIVVIGFIAVRLRQSHSSPINLPPPPVATKTALPTTLTREVAKFVMPPPVKEPIQVAPAAPVSKAPPPAPKVSILPLSLAVNIEPKAEQPAKRFAPFGRLIPCETVVAIESSRLDTPVLGLVTEDVWHNGRLIIPAGTEVHGQASVDVVRERMAVRGTWRLVWRTPNEDNGTELAVQGIALDRDLDQTTGRFGATDGSAGLRGQIVRTADNRELRIFAASWLTAATAALQDTRATVGLGGESTAPVANVRNATLAGTGAILRDYTQAMREAIARDGIYLRVPAGKPFYLYVTEPLRPDGAIATTTSNP